MQGCQRSGRRPRGLVFRLHHGETPLIVPAVPVAPIIALLQDVDVRRQLLVLLRRQLPQVERVPLLVEAPGRSVALCDVFLALPAAGEIRFG